MPRAARPQAEVDAVREGILTEGLALFARDGFEGLSMRKLGRRLSIAAKTIYNYFHNKDELYLAILTRGFDQLHARCRRATETPGTPAERLLAMGRAYVDFGLEEPNLYSLMFTWRFPRFDDYVGTPMEPAAQHELETATHVTTLFENMIRELAGPALGLSDDDMRFLIISVWAQLHGYIAGYNSVLLDYIIDRPTSIKERLLATVLDHLRADLEALRQSAPPASAAR